MNFVGLYRLAKMFAECVVPEEYGINTKNKRTIGSKMCHALLDKIRYDLTVAKSGSEMGESVVLVCHAAYYHLTSVSGWLAIIECCRYALSVG